jgi:hypothetical protein
MEDAVVLACLEKKLAEYQPRCILKPCEKFPYLKQGEGVFYLSARHLSKDLIITYTKGLLVLIYHKRVYEVHNPVDIRISCPDEAAWMIYVTRKNGCVQGFTFWDVHETADWRSKIN